MSTRERDVAHHHQLLGLRALARDPEAARPLALVHVAARGERLVFAVLRQDHAEVGGVLERPAHQRRILHAAPVVGEQAHAELCHLGHRGESIAGTTDGDRSGNAHVTQRRLRAEVEHLVHDRCAVDRRFGVRHRDDRGVAAERSGARSGLDRLGFLTSWLTQMGVEVDESGCDHASRRVEDLIGMQVGADRDDPTVVAHYDVRDAAPGRIDDTTALQEEIRQGRLLRRATSRGSPFAPRRHCAPAA